MHDQKTAVSTNADKSGYETLAQTSREAFLDESIRRGAGVGGVVAIGKYLSEIDQAIDRANNLMAETVYMTHPDGAIDYSRVNMCPNLNGNIAEAHHAGTFGIDAAVKESQLHAEMPASHGRNSVDVLIKDANGKILGKAQSKYGADAQATEAQFGNRYRGQRKLVPAGQESEINGAADRISENGVESTPLSKEEAVERQREVQKKGKIREYDYNDASAGAIGKAIGKKAAIAGCLAVGFQGARIVGRRIWNASTGKKNKSVKEDMREFVDSAAKSGVGAAGVAAAAGGAAIVVKKGWFGAAAKSVKGNVIANVVCVGVENAKILYKYGTGKVSGVEALDLAGRSNCALLGSLACGGKGAAIGAGVGVILGPVGVAVGGVIGGVVGGIAGSIAGEAVYDKTKKFCKNARKVVCHHKYLYLAVQ